MTSLIASGLALIGALITAWFQYKNNKNSDKKKEILKKKEDEIRLKISETEKELVTAMENNITDVPGLRLKIEEYRKQLKKIIGIFLILGLTLLYSGCALFQKDQPVIIGERIFYMKEGQQMIVPTLKSPAKQWYLIDDVAMLKVLGIDKPIEKPVTGVTVK